MKLKFLTIFSGFGAFLAICSKPEGHGAFLDLDSYLASQNIDRYGSVIPDTYTTFLCTWVTC